MESKKKIAADSNCQHSTRRHDTFGPRYLVVIPTTDTTERRRRHDAAAIADNFGTPARSGDLRRTGNPAEFLANSRKSPKTRRSLQLTRVDRFTVFPVAEAAVGFDVDGIADPADAAVAHRHVETAGVRAAEDPGAVESALVLAGHV